MHSRLILCLLFFGIHADAQTPAAAVPTPAQRYLDILIKRPQPGTIFERFYAAWLEESSAAELGGYLEARAKLAAAAASDHLLLAVFHGHRGDDPAALTAYAAALKLDPANASAWIERSRLEARALDFSAALQSLDEAANAKPDAASTMEIGKLRGRALLRLGQNEEALRTWKELAAAHAGDEDLSEELIDLLTDEGQYEAALETAQALIKRSRDPVARTLRQLRLSDILLLAERRDEALKILRETLAATGTDTWVEGDVLGRVSRVFRMSDDVTGLEKFMAELMKENPQRVALAWQHTQLLGEAGQKDAALKQARTLLQSNPGRRDLQEGFLDLLESLDLIKEAVEQAQALAEQNAADKEMLVRLASLQHRAKDDAAAHSTLERFLKLAGTGEAEYLRAARLLENWEEPPLQPNSAAAQAYARLVKKFPDSIGAQEAQAHYLHRASQRDAALAIWTRLAKSAALEDLLRIAQALQARLEVRTALDLLPPREKDFANEPRFFALLVQLGLASKELERTLPWARTRLRLAQDADAIEAAVKDLLLVLRSDESGKLSAPVLKELQGTNALTIQNRCLLAALFENDGKSAEAEKTLNAAPNEDKMIALSQLAQLLQNRQEWEKAAQTLQQVIELPGARTTARVQRMVDFYRRAEKPEQALTWIAEWKKLSPSAVQPWLDEARLLVRLSRAKDALALLRAALRKFPDNIEAASSYATLCVENGLPDEAERTYLALYEKTTDATARLRLIGPLALAAQQHNGVPHLVENFQQRQKQNRASAQPWLALAEIHRATGNDEERRRCLYEASRLRPQDLALLLDIARSEEEIGLTAEALRTLESAAKLDKTTKTRENIARIQIDSGDADLGYRMLFEIAGGGQMDARAIEQMADTLAAKGEWERVISFLDPLLAKHPKDYRLHYLSAIALEEAGREKDAVRSFLEIVGMHEELPGVLNTGRSIGLREQYVQRHLPPGAEDWLVLPAMMQMAYAHQQKQRQQSRYGYSSGYLGQPVNNGLPHGFIEHAPGVTESPVLALVHLLRIAGGWDAQERAGLAPQLKRAGVTDSALLLEAAENSPQLIVTPDMLQEHPQNITLHAVWLMQQKSGDPEELLPLYENAWNLFHTNEPGLASLITQLAWPIAGENYGVWLKRIFDLAQSTPQMDAESVYFIASMLQSQTAVMDKASAMPRLTKEEVRQLASRLMEWYRATPAVLNPGSVVGAQVMAENWDGVIETLKIALHEAQTKAPPAVPAGQRHRGASMLQPQALYTPPELSANFVHIGSFIQGMAPYRGDVQEAADLPEETRQRVQAMRDALRPFIVKADDARLKLILQILCGEDEALEKESNARLQSKDVTTDNYLAAAWLAQRMKKPAEAIAHLTQALKLTEAAEARLPIENAILYHAQLLIRRERDDTKTAAARAQAKVLLDAHLQSAKTHDEKYQIAQIMNSVGLAEEAQAIQQTLTTMQNRISSASRAPASPVANPYSSNRSYNSRQVQAQKTPAQLLQDGKRDLAVKAYVRQLRTTIQQTLSAQNGTSGHQQLHEVIKQATDLKLWDDVAKVLRDSAGSGWRSRVEYAVMLEHIGSSTAPALEEHRAVIAMNPRAYDSQVRLAVILAYDGKFDEAVQHWRTLPVMLQEQQLPAIVQEFTQRHQYAVVNPLALSGLLCTWLKEIDPKRALPMNIVQQLSQTLESMQRSDGDYPSLYQPWRPDPLAGLRQQRWKLKPDGTLDLDEAAAKNRAIFRKAHDELCRAMLPIPELARWAFPPLAGLALAEDDVRAAAALEPVALDVLTHLSMPKARRMLTMPYTHDSEEGYAPNTQTSFGTSQRIFMPDAALFLMRAAALRQDTHAIDDTLMPLITRVHGKQRAAYLKSYAGLLMAENDSFINEAEQWLRQQPAHALNNEGSAAEEVLRLWLKRKVSEPLDSFFTPKSASANGYGIPHATTVYTLALGERNPGLMRAFVQKLRNQWLGDDAETRRKAVTQWLEQQKKQRRNNNYFIQSSGREQAVQGYMQWLQQLLQDRRSLALLDLAIEDGLDGSPNWLRQVASHHTGNDHIRTAEEFLSSAAATGFLGDASHFRAYDLSEDQQHNTWLGSLSRLWRERSSDEKINVALVQLGKRKPTFGTNLMQALLLKNGRTVLQLDGRPTPLEAAQVTRFQSRNEEDGFAYRGAALQMVLTRHAKEIGAMSSVGQLELSLLLRDELRGYPQPDRLGEELTRVLAPLLKIESTELIRKVDQVLAAKTWSDLHEQEDVFIRQFPGLLNDTAVIDAAKAEAAARHAIELLHGSPEQKQYAMQKSRETPVFRLLTALMKVPQFLHTTLALAEQEGFSQSRNWTSSLRNHVQESLSHPENVRFVFSRAPWVAEAREFRDPKSEHNEEPTLLASLINRIENSEKLRPAVHDFLSGQPPTFGTELLLAFLHRPPGEGTNRRSFYNSKRPDDSAILAFIQKRRADFDSLPRESAANLLAMLRARMPDLDEKSAQDAALKQALQPLISAGDAQFEADTARWMQMTSLSNNDGGIYEVVQICQPLLDRLAQTDKPRAIAFLDQISKLAAQQDALNSRGGSRQQPHDTQVAQWLRNAAAVPELFGEIMQRAEDSGAARDSAWLGNVLNSARNLYKHRGKPLRIIALLEAAGMLEPAATFNPRPLPGNSQQTTMLESMSAEFTGGSTHPGLVEELGKRQPRTFGVDLITLLSSKKYNAVDEVTAFAQAHAEEIAACSAEQQKLLSGYFQRRKWADIFSANVPGLQKQFAPMQAEQAALLKVFIEELLKAKTWQDLEQIYSNSRNPAGRPGSGSPTSMNGSPPYYQPGMGIPSLSYIGDQLLLMSVTDIKKAEQVIQLIGTLYLAEFGQIKEPFRKPSLDTFFFKLCESARLVPKALQLAALYHPVRPIFGNESWNERGMISFAIPSNPPPSAGKLVWTLGEMGMLADAAHYDAVPLPAFSNRSLLGLALWRLSSLKPELCEQTVQALLAAKDVGFGHYLFAAWLTPKDAPEHARRLEQCAAHFSQLRPEVACAVLHAFETPFPELARPEGATGKLACFAPLLQQRAVAERAYLDGILAGQRGVTQPFRGDATAARYEFLRLLKTGKTAEVLKLVQALSRQFEPEDNSESFAQGPSFRRGSVISSFLRDQVRISSDESPALLACQWMAAAELPEVRILSDTQYFQSTTIPTNELFQLWARRGGWAAPKAVFADFMQQIAKHDLSSTRGLWLPVLHGALERMGPAQRHELASWAAEEKAPELQVVRHELSLALALLESTANVFAQPDRPRQPLQGSSPARKAYADAAQEASRLLQDEKIKPHVRMALAAWLTAIYPGLLDEAATQSWGLVAARAWHDGAPITRFELEALLNSAAVQPANEMWKQTSTLALERWNQREVLIKKGGSRYIQNGLYSAILRFAARAGDGATLEPFINLCAQHDPPEFYGILLESGDWRHIADVEKRKSNSSTIGGENWHWWLPPADAALREMQAAHDEASLLAEAMALSADDTATRILYPKASWKPHHVRLAAFAKKLSTIPLPEQAVQRVRTLIVLGQQHPEAALLLLPQFDAISKVFLSDTLNRTHGDTPWVQFLAIHAALKIARGDFNAANAHFERLTSDSSLNKRYGGSSATLNGVFRANLCQCLAQFWSAGIARDPEKMLQFSALFNSAEDQYENGLLPHSILKACISAWQAVLKKEPLPDTAPANSPYISSYTRLAKFLAAQAGTGKDRLTFRQRLELVARVSGPAMRYPAAYASTISVWSLLVHHGLFTADELTKNSATILQMSRTFSPASLADYGMFLREHGMFKAAAQIYARAQELWPVSKNVRPSSASYYTNPFILARAEMLIRTKDFEEARTCLAQFDTTVKYSAILEQRDALLKLLSPSAPAPAK